jgi:hypothetical protein
VCNNCKIHKYTHANHKLNALNIKYYNFGSSFDTTEFCPNKDYSSFLGGNLTMFKFCNYGFVLAK